MNPPANKMNDAGAQYVNYAGGYFKAWYITDGVVNYLPDFFDTQSRAQEAAEHARQKAINP
jgi:murein L,D-transpeptidase YcbB/YkuD